MEQAIIFAYGFDGKGGAELLEGAAIGEGIKSDAIAWVHMNADHPETRGWLEREVSYLDPFITEALLAEETSPRLTEIDGGALLFLRGVNLNEQAAPEDMVSIRLWIDAHRIISVRKRRLKAVRDIEARLLEGKGPKDAGDFVSQLVAKMFNRFEPILAALDEATDNVESDVLEDVSIEQREQIVEVRKQAIVFRRYMAPQREAIVQLYGSEAPWLSPQNKRHLQESFNRVKRYVDDLDAIRERAQIVKDEIANILSDRLNKNMYILSVIAAIFLPLGFLTGLLGINVGGIPGAENENAFVIFGGILVAIVAAQVAIFKKLKWF